MKKEEYKNKLNSLNLPKEEYYIISGGALLMYNLREETDDIDLCVSEELNELLKKEHIVTKSLKENPVPLYLLNDDIEFIVRKKEDFNATMIDGFLVESIESILDFKKRRNLEKDQPDIIKIEEYLTNKKLKDLRNELKNLNNEKKLLEEKIFNIIEEITILNLNEENGKIQKR